MKSLVAAALLVAAPVYAQSGNNLEIIHQLLPFLRLDGYWTLADITGVPDFFSQMTAFIRSALTKRWNNDFADRVRILYGGSMKPDNAKGLLAQKDVDGGLIGGASLKAESFLAVAQAGR